MVANGLFYWDFLQLFLSKHGTTRHKCLAHIQLLYMQNEITGDNTAWNLQGSSALCFIYLYVIKYLTTHSVLTAKV